MTEYMMTLRKAGGGDGVGPVRYLTFDLAAGTETRLAQAAWVKQILASFPKRVSTGPAKAPQRSGDVLFLAHGFNDSHEVAKTFHMTCADALRAGGWEGLVISFDWPSDGLVFAYLPDRANARAAASALVTDGVALLERLQRRDCQINLHVMAHSMGCFVVQQAFTWAYQDAPPGWRVGQVILVAADVDRTVFQAANYSAKMFEAHSGRLTAYTNRYDKALLVADAKFLGTAPRLGRVGLPDEAPSMMCEVDCSALFEKAYPGLGSELDPVVTHSFYFAQTAFWRDAVLTLAGGIDRAVFPTRQPVAGGPPNRFVLDPEGVSDPDFAKGLAMAKSSPAVQLRPATQGEAP